MHVPELTLKNCQCFASSLFYSNHFLTGEGPLYLCTGGEGEEEERSFGGKKIPAPTKGLRLRIIDFSKFAAGINQFNSD